MSQPTIAAQEGDENSLVPKQATQTPASPAHPDCATEILKKPFLQPGFGLCASCDKPRRFPN